MTDADATPLRRRLMLGLAGVLGLAGGAQAMLPASATLLVPGPEEGGIARWSQRLSDSLARSATAAVRLETQVLGGADGVTAANRFATSAGPDGRSLLVLTGAAAQARLVGDPRARFDPAGWLPVCAAHAPAVVVGRAPRVAALGAAGGGATLRLALDAPDAPRSAALLALDLLGVAAEPVPVPGVEQAMRALAAGEVDTIVLGAAEAAPDRLAALQARPWFTLDLTGPAAEGPGGAAPGLGPLLAGAPAARLAALRAAAAAAALPATLMLPALTGADLLALWRGAAERWLEEEARNLPPGVRVLPGAAATPLCAALAPPPEATLAYREWLHQRLGWRANR